MEGIEMKSTQIDLSEYAYVVINLNLYDGQSGVTISKKPWGKDVYTNATLNVDEWSKLARTLQELKKSAQEMHEKTQLNEMSGSRAPTLPWNVSKILSTKYMTKLNLWNAPNGMTYITLAIRPYVLNKDSEPCMQKGVGVTLSYRELHNLSDSAFSISNTISEQMSSTRFVSLVDMSDVEREQKKMELFFQMATPGQKCRVIMEKKERTWLTSSNVAAAAAAAALPATAAPTALLAVSNDVKMALPNPPSVHGTNASSLTSLESIESVSRASTPVGGAMVASPATTTTTPKVAERHLSLPPPTSIPVGGAMVVPPATTPMSAAAQHVLPPGSTAAAAQHVLPIPPAIAPLSIALHQHDASGKAPASLSSLAAMEVDAIRANENREKEEEALMRARVGANSGMGFYRQ